MSTHGLLRVIASAERQDRLLRLAEMMGHPIYSAEDAADILENGDPAKVEQARGLLISYLDDNRVAGAIKDLGMDPIMGALISQHLMGVF